MCSEEETVARLSSLGNLVTLDISSKWEHNCSWRSITTFCLSWFRQCLIQQVQSMHLLLVSGQCCPRVTDYFFLRIAELSWNAYRGKLAQGPKLQSWCYWGQTNGSLQEMLSSCAHKESKLLMDALQFGLLLSSFLSNHREQSFRKGFVYSRTLKRQHTRKHYLTRCCVSTSLPDQPDFLMGDPEAAARQAAAYGFTFTDALLLTCCLRTFKVKKTFFLHYLWMASITTVRRKIITAINN